MIGLIQRLLQVALLGVLVFAIVQPAVMPAPVRGAATAFSYFMVGNEVSWQSFTSTWKARWQWMGTYIPPMARLAQGVPSEPPALTIETLMNVMGNVFLTEPAKKWDYIKSNLTITPTVSSSSAGQ